MRFVTSLFAGAFALTVLFGAFIAPGIAVAELTGVEADLAALVGVSFGIWAGVAACYSFGEYLLGLLNVGGRGV